MSFIETIHPARAQGPLCQIYERISGGEGDVGELTQALSLNPQVMDRHFELYSALMLGRGELDRRTREMLGVIVSATNGCAYCVAHHSASLRSYKVDAGLLSSLELGLVPEELVSSALARLLEFAVELTRCPVRDRSSIEELRAQGWSDGAILESTLIVGYFSFTNRLVAALGVELEEGFEELHTLSVPA